MNMFVVSVYQEVKKALSSSETTNLCCRETEIKGITTFLTNHLNNKESGSLYISGAPGTGKTACLNQILQAVKVRHLIQHHDSYFHLRNNILFLVSTNSF